MKFELCIMNFLGQLWLRSLANKGNIWKPEDHCWITDTPTMKKVDNIDVGPILNNCTKKYLGILQNGEVTEQIRNLNNSGQLWGKITSTIDPGYFVFTNVEIFWLKKFLTATSDLELGLKGMY